MPSGGPAAAYRFAEFVLDIRAFRLERAGVWLHVEPKALEVLLYLLQHPSEVVSKQDLITHVWKGISVTDNAVARVVANLRHALGDSAAAPRFIETVPTRGYRFCGEVAEAASESDGAAGTEAPPAAATPEPRVPFARRPLVVPALVVLSILLLLGAAVIVRAVAERLTAEPARMSPGTSVATEPGTLAVLPFRNLSGDEKQDYLAEGIAQAISDRLFELRASTVKSALSLGRLQAGPASAIRVARELNVGLLLDGDVHRHAGGVRVTVRLLDGHTANIVWHDTFDEPFTELLNLYDTVATKVAAQAKLAVEMVDDARRLRRTIDAEGYDDYLHAMKALSNNWMAGGCVEAEPILLRVVGRNPSFAAAHAALGWCYEYPARLGRGIEDVGPKARHEAEEAVRLDEKLALGHAVKGTVAWRVDYDPVEGEAELGRALELGPYSALVLLPSAEIRMYRGNVDAGLKLLERAIALDPYSAERHAQVGFCFMTVGRDREAIGHFRRALELDPSSKSSQFWLAEALAYTSDRDGAMRECMKSVTGALRADRAVAAQRALEDARLRGGWKAFWRVELELARDPSIWSALMRRFTNAWLMARRLARLEEWGATLDALEQACDERQHLVATLPVERLFAPLHGHPRFRALLTRTAAAGFERGPAPR